MNLPKTPKGLSNKITKIRSQFSAFKREYGGLDDGGGARYYLFYLYFLLGDNRRSSAFLRWYEKEFPYCGTGYIFHKRPHFLEDWGGKLFGGKEIERAGGKLSDLLNPVPIPQKTTFLVEVA